MASQINKLDFLMQSLIKMSRLETGTFVLHMEEVPLDKTIAQAIQQRMGESRSKKYPVVGGLRTIGHCAA